MVSYQFKRNGQTISRELEQEQEEVVLSNPDIYLTEDIEESYQDVEPKLIESLKKYDQSILKKTKNSYKEKTNQLTSYYRDNVNLQKSYYNDEDSHWMKKQREIRNELFLRKILIVCVLLVILFLFFYFTH